MNLLHIVHYPVFGGPHNQALRLNAPLNRRGWNTTVLIPDEPGNAAARLSDGSVDVVQMPLGRLRATPNPLKHAGYAGRFVRDVASVRHLIRQRAIDLVVIAGLVNAQGAVAARLEGKPVVWQIVDTRTPAVLEKVLLPVVRTLAASVMVTGETMAASYAEKLRGTPVFAFYPPVDCARFAPDDAARAELRREWRAPPDELIAGSVANINPQKGIEHLISALEQVRRAVPHSRLLLAGAEYETHRAYSRELRRLIADHHLREGEDVLFLGSRSDIERVVQGFDIFVSGSVPRSEGTPTSIIEAMAAGKPAVATDVGGVRDLVRHEVDGFLVPPESPAAIANAIAELASPSVRERMSAAARESALRRFDLPSCVDAHIKAFEAALKGHKRPSLVEAA